MQAAELVLGFAGVGLPLSEVVELSARLLRRSWLPEDLSELLEVELAVPLALTDAQGELVATLVLDGMGILEAATMARLVVSPPACG